MFSLILSKSRATKFKSTRVSLVFYKSNCHHVVYNYKSANLLTTQSSYSLINISKCFLSTNNNNSASNHQSSNTKLDWLPKEIIDPMLNPTQKSAISDPNSILTTEEKQVIEGCINKITKVKVAVLIINKMNKEYINSYDSSFEAAQQFAIQIHDDWKLGDRGVLLFYSTKDCRMYISTKKELHYTLTRYNLGPILMSIGPELESKQYGKAIIMCINGIRLILAGESTL